MHSKIRRLLLIVLLGSIFLSVVPFVKVVKASSSFGYATIATYTYKNIENRIEGSVFTMGVETGQQANSISVILWTAASWSGKVKCAIYLHSDSSLVGQTEERTVTVTTSKVWYVFNFTTKPSLTASMAYNLVAWAEAKSTGDVYMAKDVGDTNQEHFKILTYGSFPSSVAFSHGYYKHSIYCNYSAIPPLGSWHDVETWNFDLLTRRWSDIELWSLNLATRVWTNIGTWNFNLITRQWTEIEIWSFGLITRTFHNIETWNFQLLTRQWTSIETWISSLNLTTEIAIEVILLCIAIALFLVFFAPTIWKEIEKIVGFRFRL